jgi:DNA-binding NarL/FixJ family response regulator
LLRSCGAVPLAERVRGQLVVLGAKPRRGSAADRDELTAAELRVARLAGAGATNRHVAAELYISAKTVEYHLTSIYRKLDITSRHELPLAVQRALAA